MLRNSSNQRSWELTNKHNSIWSITDLTLKRHFSLFRLGFFLTVENSVSKWHYVQCRYLYIYIFIYISVILTFESQDGFLFSLRSFVTAMVSCISFHASSIAKMRSPYDLHSPRVITWNRYTNIFKKKHMKILISFKTFDFEKTGWKVIKNYNPTRKLLEHMLV